MKDNTNKGIFDKKKRNQNDTEKIQNESLMQAEKCSKTLTCLNPKLQKSTKAPICLNKKSKTSNTAPTTKTLYRPSTPFRVQPEVAQGGHFRFPFRDQIRSGLDQTRSGLDQTRSVFEHKEKSGNLNTATTSQRLSQTSTFLTQKPQTSYRIPKLQTPTKTPIIQSSSKKPLFLNQKSKISNSLQNPRFCYPTNKTLNKKRSCLNRLNQNTSCFIPKGNPKGNNKLNEIRSKEQKNPLNSSETLYLKKNLEKSIVDQDKKQKVIKNTKLNKKRPQKFPGFKGTFEERERFKNFINDKLVTLIKNKKSNLINRNKKKKEKNIPLKKSLFSAVGAVIRKKRKQGRFSLRTSWKSQNRKQKKPFYTKFVNLLMINGNKTKAHKIFAKTLTLLKTKDQRKKTNKINPVNFIIKGKYNSKLAFFSYNKLILLEKKKERLQVVIKTPVNKKKKFFLTYNSLGQEKLKRKGEFLDSNPLGTYKTKDFVKQTFFVDRGFCLPYNKGSLSYTVSKKPNFSRFFCWFFFDFFFCDAKKNAKKNPEVSFEKARLKKKLDFFVNLNYASTLSSKFCFLPKSKNIQSVLETEINQLDVSKFNFYSQKLSEKRFFFKNNLFYSRKWKISFLDKKLLKKKKTIFQKNKNKLKNRVKVNKLVLIQKIVSKKKEPFSRLPCYRRGFYFPPLKYLKKSSPKFPASGVLSFHSSYKKNKKKLLKKRLKRQKLIVSFNNPLKKKNLQNLTSSKKSLLKKELSCSLTFRKNKNKQPLNNNKKLKNFNIQSNIMVNNREGEKKSKPFLYVKEVNLDNQQIPSGKGFAHFSPKKRPAPEKTQIDLKIKEKIKKNRETPLDLVKKAVENVKPCVEVRKVKRGKRFYQVPAFIRAVKRERLAICWLIESAQKRKKTGISFSKSLALELLEALKKQGKARQKRTDLHKLAKINRDNFRYSWW